MSRLWMTSYRANPAQQPAGMAPGEYGTFIEARKLSEAKNAALARGLGEVVAGQSLGGHDVPKPSRMIRAGLIWSKRMEAMHAITFICYMALQAKVVEPYEVLGDEGVLHQAIHQFLYGGTKLAWLRRELERIEGLIPGFPKRPRRRRFA